MVPTPEPSPEVNPLPEDLVEVGVYFGPSAAFDHGLVILAMGRACWLVPADQFYRLLVEPRDLAEVRRQLRCFDRESAGWPPPPIEPHTRDRHIDVLTPVIWAFVILVCFWGETLSPAWVDRGALDAQAVFLHHELWRPLTALFLHADAGHLISNGLIGVIIFAATTTTFGRVRGWLLIALSAVVGNLGVAALNLPGPYRSLGASTAIFAAVGLLTGRGLRLVIQSQSRSKWRALLVPIVAGSSILGLYGAGGVHVDLMAHVTGFVAGTAFGLLGTRIGSWSA